MRNNKHYFQHVKDLHIEVGDTHIIDSKIRIGLLFLGIISFLKQKMSIELEAV